MIERYFGASFPARSRKSSLWTGSSRTALSTPPAWRSMNNQFSGAGSALDPRAPFNKYIDENTPWALARMKKKGGWAPSCNLCESSVLSVSCCCLLCPSRKIWAQLGIDDRPELQNWESLASWELLRPEPSQSARQTFSPS